MRHTITASALSAALLISTAAYADNTTHSSQATIDTLPIAGTVSLSGVVERVVDGDTFILRDNADETIDVHTATNVSVNVGDHVSVRGEKTDEIAGMGEEITQASVTLNRNTTDNTAATTYDLSGNRMADAEGITRSETIAATGADNMANDRINALPEEGNVELRGVVAEVDDRDSFTLRDAMGDTIDVKTANNVQVQPGDRVSVNGLVNSKMLGFGRQIENADVIVVSATN
jgi:uncharacterized protein YdeI (BOF family)